VSIKDIKFTGLIQNQKFTEITGPAFLNALRDVGWKEGTNTHFFKSLKEDGPSRDITTPKELERAIEKGESEPANDGKWIHRMVNDTAYIVFNPDTKTLITFSQGSPPNAKQK